MPWWDAEGVGHFFPPPEPNSKRDTKRWKEFREYDNNHPDIWDEFKKRTFEAWERGFRKIGAHFIIHQIRWECKTEKSTDMYKINHNYFPYYARKFMHEFPDYQGIFELRSLIKHD